VKKLFYLSKSGKNPGFSMLQTRLKLSANHLTNEGKEELATQLQEIRQQGTSWQKLSKISPISLSTMRRWAVNDMKKEMQRKRIRHQRRRTTLDPEEIVQLLNDAKNERSQFRPVDGAWARARIREITHGRVMLARPSYIAESECFPSDLL
jgi:hypothetical protein